MGPWNPDNQVFIPIGTIFKNFISRHSQTVTLNVRAPNPNMVEETKAEAEGIMRKIRGLSYDEPNDFTINQQEGFTGAVQFFRWCYTDRRLIYYRIITVCWRNRNYEYYVCIR
ncbi:MAG: hypothetical protein MZV64_04395 [Ignavibacteriales bacterium]|nr:hypothetical protein [Ignavibacteriales bacterium]